MSGHTLHECCKAENFPYRAHWSWCLEGDEDYNAATLRGAVLILHEMRTQALRDGSFTASPRTALAWQTVCNEVLRVRDMLDEMFPDWHLS